MPPYAQSFNDAAFQGGTLVLSATSTVDSGTSDLFGATNYYTINNANGWTFGNGAFYAVRWYDTNAYYVQANNNELMIYHGRIGGGVLYKPVEVERTGVTTADVPPYTVAQLITGVQEDSLKAAQSYVAGLVATQHLSVCTQTPTAPGCSTPGLFVPPATGAVTTTTKAP